MGVSLTRMIAAGLVAAVALAAPATAQSQRVTGAGASFPFPLYSAWFQAYSAATPGVRIDYQSTGSGAGVRSFIDRTIDFGASDSAMTDEEIAQVEGGAVILPMTAGEIVLAYNLPGVTELRLPRDVYPLIFTGEITNWSDERIVAANPDVELPDQTITVARRSDSSGTTFVFTRHLSAVNASFGDQLGVGTTVQWPNLPNFVGSPRNDGVTATVMQTPGSIGYIEYGFALMSGTPMAMLENASGNYVMPGGEAGTLALASAVFEGDDLRVFVDDPSDPGAYPIATFTWMLFYRDSGKPEIQAVLRDFVDWAMADGQAMAKELSYVPLPPNVVEKVLAQRDLIQ